MKIANQLWGLSRKVLRVYLILGLSVLGVNSSSATTKQTIATSNRPERQCKQEVPVPSQPSDSKGKVTFQLRLISDGILCPIEDQKCAGQEIWWKDFALLASDGHTLHLVSIPFPNAERSKKHFEASIKEAEKILRRDPESDGNGETIGERALGSFPAIKDMKSPWGVPHYRLFWTWGKNYLELEGEHLEDVLVLESRLKVEGINAVWTWHKPYDQLSPQP
jgi:hypothetical protein